MILDTRLQTSVHLIFFRVVLLVSGLLLTAESAAGQVVRFYEHLAYQGSFFDSSVDMPFVGWDWNDQITSVDVPEGATVRLYEHENYGGAELVLTARAEDLRHFSGPGADNSWNDATSSIRISYSPPPPSPTRTVLLVNGSFNAYPPWMNTGSPQWSSIASTYGVQPTPFRWVDNGFPGVQWPYYGGIWNGASQLGGVINALGGEVEVVTHSHGGNVAVLATSFYTNRPVQRLINLATPVNFDIRYLSTPNVWHMCTASSYFDTVQFIGASPVQVNAFAQAAYNSYHYSLLSAQAFLDGREADAFYYAGLAAQSVMNGWDWWISTKLENWGWTIFFDGASHGDMHEPPIWGAIPYACKVP